MTFKLLDKYSMSNITFMKGIKEIAMSKVVRYEANFVLDYLNLRMFLKNFVYDKASRLEISKLKQLKDIYGVSGGVDLISSVNTVLTKMTDNLVLIVQILTSYSDVIDVQKSLRVKSINVPKFLLDILQNVNCCKFNYEVTNTNSLLRITNFSFKINYVKKKDESNDPLDLCIRLKTLNDSLKLIGYTNIVEVNDYSELFNMPENFMNVSSKPEYLEDGSISKVHYRIGYEHSEEDIEKATLLFQEFIFNDSSDIRFLETNITRDEMLDILMFNNQIGSLSKFYNHQEDDYYDLTVGNSTVKKPTNLSTTGKKRKGNEPSSFGRPNVDFSINKDEDVGDDDKKSTENKK